MKKMHHLFEAENNRTYDPKIKTGSEWVAEGEGVITEKLDGTNVRLTVRQGAIVRVERRRNPTKAEKSRGVIDPWYQDARDDDPAAKYILLGAKNTDASRLPDGEHTAEALGPKIQGNPYRLEQHVIVPHCEAPVYPDMLRTYDNLAAWCGRLQSLFAPGREAEGVVFHHPDGRMVKLRARKFWLP